MHVQVLQADGGELCAAINAATLALIDAGVPLSDYLVACSAASVDRELLLDPTHTEASAASAVVPIAILARSRRIVMCRAVSRLALDSLRETTEAAVEGAAQMFEVLRAVVHEHTIRQLSSRRMLTA